MILTFASVKINVQGNLARKKMLSFKELNTYYIYLKKKQLKDVIFKNISQKNTFFLLFFMCPFLSSSNLIYSKFIFVGERPFQCGICQKRFRQKAHLQKHETTHSSATPYQCPHCDKAFGHPSNLNTHIATHSDVR